MPNGNRQTVHPPSRRKEHPVNIQGYQKVTLLDFPGRVACTVFTGGCNLRCPFCHNGGLVREPLAHPNAAAEVLDYLSTRCGILDGVCLTGGEPLLQPDLADFIAKVKDMGLAVKLDTNGSLPERLRAVLSTGLVDHVAMDIKSSLPGYPKAIGCDMDTAPFVESMAIIRQSGASFEFRTTVVKGLHTADDLVAVAAMIGDVPYFLQKFVDSGHLLTPGWSAFSDDDMQSILTAVRVHTPRAAIRG